MHIERSASGFWSQIRARGILKYFVKLQHICFEISFPGQGSGLRVAFNKGIASYPVEKILTAAPERENNVRISLVDRSQDLIGNKSFHLIDKSSALPKYFFERVRILRLYVQTISNCNHVRALVLLICICSF